VIPQCKRQIRTRDLLYVVYWITKWALFRLLVALSKNFPEGCEEPMPRLIIRFDLSYMQDLGGRWPSSPRIARAAKITTIDVVALHC
jgi:hypothetical protein